MFGCLHGCVVLLWTLLLVGGLGAFSGLFVGMFVIGLT